MGRAGRLCNALVCERCCETDATPFLAHCSDKAATSDLRIARDVQSVSVLMFGRG
jgi:hypothetical protein